MRTIIDDCKTRPVNSKYKIFVLDECQMLTVQAWNSLLKILEEPPSYVIFLFCTTDPQKIIGTVMSRVQRFNFQRISVEGIYNRLKYIIENENKERKLANIQPIIYEDNALKYIARLAKGGMRDSITTLEKCLDYNENLTTENVIKVTSGGVTENTLREFTQYVISNKPKEALLLFNEIYMSGIDVLLFIKLYIEFVDNCVKFLITRTPNITTLSDETINWLYPLTEYTDYFRNLLASVSEIRTTYNSEDLRIIVESWVIKVCR